MPVEANAGNIQFEVVNLVKTNRGRIYSSYKIKGSRITFDTEELAYNDAFINAFSTL